jgi:hypothetical protein
VRKGIVAVSVALACLGIAACGSSKSSSTVGSGSTTASTSPSAAAKASFDANLGAVCTRADNAFIAAHGNKSQAAVIARYLIVFRSVKAPSQLQSLYSRYLAVLGQELAALKRGDRAQLFKLVSTKAGPLVTAMGATRCRSNR